MGREAGLDPAPSLAGQSSSSAASGCDWEPAVAEDVTSSSTRHQLRKARSVIAKPRHRRRSTSKRLALAAGSAAAIAAVAVLALSATFGFFSATSSAQGNNFPAGTVNLSSDATGACTVAAILPGTSPTPCTLKATYSGSVSAYLGLDVLIETQAGSGGTPLYDPTGPAGGLQISVTDNQGTPVTYTVPTTATTCPGSAPAGSTCYGLNDELVNMTAFSGTPSVTFATAVTLPTSSASGYQGGKAQIIVTAHAVQSGNNNFVGSCTAGHTCGSAGNWS